MNKVFVIVAIVLGVAFIIVAVIYFIEPARFLPSFFPGYDRAMMAHHYKHSVGSLILGVASFIFAWFQSGKKKSSVKEEENG